MTLITTMTNKFKAWWLALRPRTLTASIIPVLVGSALIFAFSDSFNWTLTLYALLGALFIQIGTNLFNDVIDFKKGVDNKHRLGPVRVTQGGLISPNSVLLGAWCSFVVAFIFGIPLVLAGGWVIVFIGVLSLFFGYIYTAGPYPLSYIGLGDLFVLLFFGIVAVSGVYYLQSGRIDAPAVIAGLQIGLLATALIAINNLRDRATDQLAHKKTLAVRFGEKFAKVEIITVIILPFCLNIIWVFSGYWWVALLPFLTAPLALKLAKSIIVTKPGEKYNLFLAQAAKLHFLFGICLSAGLVLQ